MAKLTICVTFLLAAVGGSYTADAWAADVVPTKAPASLADATAAPRPCADPADFITTNCQLTWHGITLFGIVDMGFGWPADSDRAARADTANQHGESAWGCATHSRRAA